jgi:hypothetical protein
MSEESKERRKNQKNVGKIKRMSEESKERRKNQKNVGKIKRMSEKSKECRVLVNRKVSGRRRVARAAGGVLWDRTGEREIGKERVGNIGGMDRQDRATFVGDIGGVVKWSGIECPSTNNQGENSMSILPEISRIQCFPIIPFERI